MLLVNAAGGTAADPILTGLGFEWVMGASTMDASAFTGAWIDANNTVPGTNSVVGPNLSPGGATPLIALGSTATYTLAGNTLNIGSTTGLATGDYIYLSAAGITAGFYRLTVLNASSISVVNPTTGANPFAADTSNVSFQVAWRYKGTAGTSPSLHGAAATLNYYKTQLADSAGNVGQQVDSDYIMDQPTMASGNLVTIGAKVADGTQTINTLTPTLAILPGWASHGGVLTVALANHSVQAVDNFQWLDGTTGEKTLAYATTAGNFKALAQGVNYGALVLRSATASAITVSINIQTNVDTVAPTVTFAMFGR